MKHSRAEIADSKETDKSNRSEVLSPQKADFEGIKGKQQQPASFNREQVRLPTKANPGSLTRYLYRQSDKPAEPLKATQVRKFSPRASKLQTPSSVRVNGHEAVLNINIHPPLMSINLNPTPYSSLSEENNQPVGVGSPVQNNPEKNKSGRIEPRRFHSIESKVAPA